MKLCTCIYSIHLYIQVKMNSICIILTSGASDYHSMKQWVIKGCPISYPGAVRTDELFSWEFKFLIYQLGPMR